MFNFRVDIQPEAYGDGLNLIVRVEQHDGAVHSSRARITYDMLMYKSVIDQLFKEAKNALLSRIEAKQADAYEQV